MFLITAIGTIGFMVIEQWNFIDSLYMTIITMSTVGFGEVQELSFGGKMFTSFLIISCFGTFAYAVSTVTSYIVGGQYRIYLREYRIIKKINKMENHIIICGFGRVGKQVAHDLKLQNQAFVIIEKDVDAVADFRNDASYSFLHGDSTNDEILVNANIFKAKAIITCLPKDTDNIYVVLSAREKRNNITIIARATEFTAVSKLKMAGATKVIMPDSIGGSHMAAMITNPLVTDFMDYVKIQGNKGVNIESMHFDEMPLEFQNKTIEEIGVKHKAGITIIGYRAPNGEYFINPDLNTKIVEQSQLFFLGTTEQIKNMNSLFGLNK